MYRSGPGCKLHGCESLEARVRSSGIVVGPPVLDDLPRVAAPGDELLVQALITQALAEIEVARYTISTPIRTNGSGDCVSSGRTAKRDRTTLRPWNTTDDQEEGRMFMRAVHSGEVLKRELEELGVPPTEFARQIDVPPNLVSQIIDGKRSVTGATALRFGRWFGRDPRFWLNLQAQYDLVQADREPGAEIRHLPMALGFREGEPFRGSHDQT